MKYCHVWECDYRRGLDWWLYLLTTYRQLVTTSNCNSLTGLHTLKITVTAAHINSSVVTSRYLATDLNNVLCSCSYCLTTIPQLTHCFNRLTPRLAAISQQPPSLRFTDWLNSTWSSLPCIALHSVTNYPGYTRNIPARTAHKTSFLYFCSIVAY
jgi:hypothetical protein